MKMFFIYMALLVTSSCTKTFYNTTPPDVVRDSLKSIHLDETYQLYVRQICRTRRAADFYSAHNPAASAAVTYCNCEDGAGERVELEYLFYSEQKKNFLFITTIPPYVLKNETKISYDQAFFTKAYLVNVFFMHTFSFGKVNNGNQVIFQDGSKTETWSIAFSRNKSEITVTGVPLNNNNVNPADVFSLPVKFVKKDKFVLCFEDGSHNPLDEEQNPAVIDSHDTIYTAANFRGFSKVIFFKFDIPYRTTSRNSYTWLYFTPKRINYSPFPVMD